jgi:hypothetical protein
MVCRVGGRCVGSADLLVDISLVFLHHAKVMAAVLVLLICFSLASHIRFVPPLMVLVLFNNFHEGRNIPTVLILLLEILMRLTSSAVVLRLTDA